MGLHSDINAAIRSSIPTAFKSGPLTTFAGNGIAVDASLYLYQQSSGILKSLVSKMPDAALNVNREELLRLLTRNIISFSFECLRRRINPIWVLEGESIPEKLSTVEKRHKSRQDNIEKRQELLESLSTQDIFERDPQLVEKLRKRTINDNRITGLETQAIFEIVTKWGFSVVRAPHEAESYACSLNQQGYADLIYTNDTDVYALGGARMIGSIFWSSETIISWVDVSEILTGFSMTQAQFRDFCILMGTDFNNKLPGLGFEKTLNYFRDIGMIAERAAEKFDFSKLQLDLNRSRELLTPPEVGHTPEQLCFDYDRFLQLSPEDTPVLKYGLTDIYLELFRLRELPEPKPPKAPVLLQPRRRLIRS